MSTNSRYRIIVSEPWDFVGPAGNNLIEGIVLKVLSTRCIVFCSDDPLTFAGMQCRILILSSRYEDFGIDIDKEALTVNGGCLTVAFDETLSEEGLKARSRFVIIGRLEKVPD